MKKILAIIGSPRKAGTYEAVARFEEQLKRIEDVQVEYIMLGKVGLSDCAGCHNCILKGMEFCKDSQKVNELKEKMSSADAVILASPVYNQNVTALMKKFLDYFSFLWHRPDMFGVKFFGISSGGGMFKEVFRHLKTNAESWGGTWTGELGVPHYEALTPKYKQKLDNSFQAKAEKFLTDIENKELPVPSVNQLMMFNIWKMNAVACKDSNPADFAYWTDKQLLDKTFYYPVRIGIFKRALVACIARIARGFMKKAFLGYEEC